MSFTETDFSFCLPSTREYLVLYLMVEEGGVVVVFEVEVVNGT